MSIAGLTLLYALQSDTRKYTVQIFWGRITLDRMILKQRYNYVARDIAHLHHIRLKSSAPGHSSSRVSLIFLPRTFFSWRNKLPRTFRCSNSPRLPTRLHLRASPSCPEIRIGRSWGKERLPLANHKQIGFFRPPFSHHQDLNLPRKSLQTTSSTVALSKRLRIQRLPPNSLASSLTSLRKINSILPLIRSNRN